MENKNHNVKIKDLRPIMSKTTKICMRCGATGRDLIKYKTCDDYFSKPMRRVLA